MITKDDLDNRFDYHRPANDNVAALHGDVRFHCRRLAGFIVAATVPGREQSLAVTACEEAMMWANAAIARNQ